MKWSMTLLLLLVMLEMMAQKRVKFTQLPTMPEAVLAFGYADDGRNIYLIGGASRTRQYNAYFLVFNGQSLKWTQRNLPDLKRTKYSSAVFMKDHSGVFMAGGTTPYGTSAALNPELNIYYPEESQFEVVGLSEPGAKNLGTAYADSKVYLFGGSISMQFATANGPRLQYSDKFVVYDATAGTLEELPDLPVAMETKGGIYDGYLYVFGGFSDKALREVWRYHLDRKFWEELEPLSEPVSSYALAQYGQYFFLVGNYPHQNQLIAFNAATQQVKYYKTNVKGHHMGAAVLGDILHVFGGASPFPEEYAKDRHYVIHTNHLIDFD